METILASLILLYESEEVKIKKSLKRFSGVMSNLVQWKITHWSELARFNCKLVILNKKFSENTHQNESDASWIDTTYFIARDK